MIRNVLILTFNDLAIAVKNKTLYLVLFVPLFVFLTLKLIDADDRGVQKLNIGLLENAQYSSAMIQSVKSAEHVFTVSWLPNEEEGKRWLKEKNGDGILVPSATEPASTALIVLEKASLQTVAIVESISRLQRMLEGGNKNWIAEVHSLHDNGLQKQMLPTWILMLLLTVSFIVLPAQVAEEKEKNFCWDYYKRRSGKWIGCLPRLAWG